MPIPRPNQRLWLKNQTMDTHFTLICVDQPCMWRVRREVGPIYISKRHMSVVRDVRDYTTMYNGVDKDLPCWGRGRRWPTFFFHRKWLPQCSWCAGGGKRPMVRRENMKESEWSWRRRLNGEGISGVSFQRDSSPATSIGIHFSVMRNWLHENRHSSKTNFWTSLIFIRFGIGNQTTQIYTHGA